MKTSATAWVLLVLLSLTGRSLSCFKRSSPTPPASTTTTTTTTTRAPVVEDVISANAVANNDRGNAWSSGSGIDWTHVGPGGRPNRGGSSSSSSGSASRPSGSSPGSNSASSANLPPIPDTPLSVSKNDLRTLSRELLDLDANAVGSMIVLNKQGRTSSANKNDIAPNNLFTSVSQEALQGPTISKLWALLDNYDPSVLRSEQDTTAEAREIQEFLDAVIATPIMTKAEEFLRTKGLIRKRLRDVLEEIWFTPYTRSRNTLGSSGFEHVFVGEIKGGKVSGFHNWVSFYKEEQEGDLDYFGYMKTADIGSKGEIILLKFNWLQEEKPVGSMLVGTSPELDMALYTVCFFARPGNNCPIQLGGHRLSIKTHYQNYNGKRYVGTAFPNI